MRGAGAIITLFALAACSPQPDVLAVSTETITTQPYADRAAAPLTDAGIWSANGVLLRDKPVFSPDGRFILQMTSAGILVSGEARGLLAQRSMGDAPPEILWSPYGPHVAISWRNDDAIGVWSVDAYDLGAGAPRDVGLGRFTSVPGEIKYSEGNTTASVNRGAIAWQRDGLILITEHPLGMTWARGSAFDGLKMPLEATGTLSLLDPEELLASWRQSLGPRSLADLSQKAESQSPPTP